MMYAVLPALSVRRDDMAGLLDFLGAPEARLTQSRMNLTPSERMQRPPWMEFDVPPEQQIVRGLLGQ